MLYLTGILVASQIVFGQILWKTGVEKANVQLTKSYILSSDFLKLLINPYILTGVVFYGIATVSYILLLSRYQYSSLQAVIVCSSLILTFLAAATIFGERISVINLVGVSFMLVGVILVTKF